MRISLVGPAWPYRGGISHYNTCLARELSAGHEVEVVNYSRLYPEFLFPGRTQYDESRDAHVVESVRILDSINPFTWVRTGFHIVRSRPDLVIVQWWHPYFAPALFKVCSIVRLFSRARVVFLCHNVKPHERSAVDRALTRLAFSTAHAFLVHSEGDLADLMAMRKSVRAEVNPHPIYDFFRTGMLSSGEAREILGEPDGPLILFFGYIRPYKGLKVLLESLARIREEIPARLLVVGEFYEDSGPYHELVERLGLEDAVDFVDSYVPNEEVGAYFSACDLVVLPYLSATQSGIAQIAIAFDRPMIVTRVGGLPEVVSEGRTGFVVPPSDPEAMAEQAVAFFRDGLAASMQPHFEAERKRFSWEALASRLIGLAGTGEGDDGR